MLRHLAIEKSSVTSGAAKNVLFSSRSKRSCCILKEFEKTSFFLEIKHPFCEKTENKKFIPKRVVKEAHFSFLFVYFSS